MTTLYRGRSESEKPICFLVVDALELPMVIEQPGGKQQVKVPRSCTSRRAVLGLIEFAQFLSYHKHIVESELHCLPLRELMGRVATPRFLEKGLRSPPPWRAQYVGTMLEKAENKRLLFRFDLAENRGCAALRPVAAAARPRVARPAAPLVRPIHREHLLLHLLLHLHPRVPRGHRSAQ